MQGTSLPSVPLQRQCGKQFNERSVDVRNQAQYPSDIIALLVLWRLCYKLSLRDPAEMFLTRSFTLSCESAGVARCAIQCLPTENASDSLLTQGPVGQINLHSGCTRMDRWLNATRRLASP